ncbi:MULTISPECIES: outer membrane protein assembly factor BamE [unclassified Novosphingobium]|uniref:outer membrane protein assembly factor BamE n=1 Tax=unclassified Novosphingobium TaxID=2644732 RepID=UPI0026012CB4|nr:MULTISPECIES: outer membrane protein assembly factor BamE [unclassified Novosphingobium]HQV02210.1 outer membrane protein assembly factor BamE [Novosphingobium sp.]
MQGKVRFLGVAVAVLALSACASIKDRRGYLVDNALLDSVQPGIDNQMSVERMLGRPSYISQYGRKDWYYISTNTRQAAFTRPKAKEQLMVKITFDEKGNVAGVERSGIEKVVQFNPDGDKTPTLGRERTFLEDLFGNIGQVGAAGTGGGAGGGPNGS